MASDLGHSVDTNLIDAYDYITKLLDLNTPVDMIIQILPKAFDKSLYHQAED